MPPIPADFLAPKGEIEAGFFPKDSASSRVARFQQYIDNATERTNDLDPEIIDVDAAIVEWTYVQLYDAILLRLANTPDTTIADEGGIRFSATQISIFENKRAEHAGAYEAIIVDAAVPLQNEIAPTTHARIIHQF